MSTEEQIKSTVERVRTIFINILELKDTNIEELNYRDCGWDSLNHMRLVSELENTFNIMFDTNDILDMSSFNKCIEILKKNGVEFDERKQRQKEI